MQESSILVQLQHQVFTVLGPCCFNIAPSIEELLVLGRFNKFPCHLNVDVLGNLEVRWEHDIEVPLVNHEGRCSRHLRVKHGLNHWSIEAS